MNVTVGVVWLRILVLVLLCGPSVSAQTSRVPNPAPVTQTVAFLHANIIPMDEERVLHDHTVIVANGKIVEVGPTSAVKVPEEALRIDAQGRYLLPAFCDMHVHLLGDAWNMLLRPDAQAASKNIEYERFFFPFVANGVTTVQALSATPQEITFRNQIERGDLLGPRLILARMIDGPQKAWPPPLSTWVASAHEANDAVRHSKKEGYDKIKVYSFLSRESYDAIVSAAREVEMDVIGHIPMSLSVEYVLDAGQRLIAHTEEVAKHAAGDYSAERINYFADKIAERGVWMVPTLVTTRSILNVFDEPDRLLSRPEAAYFRHPMQLGVWSFIVENLYRPIPAEARQGLRDAFEQFQRPLTKALHEKQPKLLLAGTDASFPELVPGFSLHGELRELVNAGLTPFEALRTSTTNPFAYLGESERRGTIAAGMESDLILLAENPLDDISAASRVEGVLIRGRWIGADEIQRKLQEIAASFELPRVSPTQK